MIAKLIAHGPTREEALARLADALAETEVGGVTTNLPFLRWLVAHPVLRAGEATTAFLTEYPPLSEPPLRLPDAAVARRLAAQPAVGGARCRRPTSTAPRTTHVAARRREPRDGADAGNGDPASTSRPATASRRGARCSCSRR